MGTAGQLFANPDPTCRILLPVITCRNACCTVATMRNGEVSYWWHARGGFPPRRPSLPRPEEADVCIVGAGYTGLWTAYYLEGMRPTCGSWCSRPPSPDTVRRVATAAG